MAFSLSNLLPGFHSSDITSDELESIIKDAVRKENPNDDIKVLGYTEDGIKIELESGQLIEIEIDWQEILIS
jgi:hypothetical protein